MLLCLCISLKHREVGNNAAAVVIDDHWVICWVHQVCCIDWVRSIIGNVEDCKTEEPQKCMATVGLPSASMNGRMSVQNWWGVRPSGYVSQNCKSMGH